jgi:hypothetical protein
MASSVMIITSCPTNFSGPQKKGRTIAMASRGETCTLRRGQPSLWLENECDPCTEPRGLKRGYESAFDERVVSPPVPRKADGWTRYAMSLEWLKGYCQQAGNPNAVCCIENIHVDPWDDISIEVSS